MCWMADFTGECLIALGVELLALFKWGHEEWTNYNRPKLNRINYTIKYQHKYIAEDYIWDEIEH